MRHTPAASVDSPVVAAMSIGSQKYSSGLGTMPGWSSLSRIIYRTLGSR
jgi:hypothetical protein